MPTRCTPRRAAARRTHATARMLLPAAAVAAVGLSSTAAHANQRFWNGGGNNNNWSNVNNWAPFFGPPANDGTDDIIMQGTTRLTPLVDIDYDILSLQFNSTAGPFLFQAGGQDLSIRGGGIVNNDADLQIISRILLATNHTWNAAAGPLQVNSVRLGGLSNGQALTVAGGFATTITGTIAGSALTGSGSLILNSTANLTLGDGLTAQANTFTGPVTVNGGTLVLNKPAGTTAVPGNLIIGDGAGSDGVRFLRDNQIADASNVTINSSGVLNFNTHWETLNNLTINGGFVLMGPGAVTINGALTLNGGGVSNGGGSFSIGGPVQLTGARVNASGWTNVAGDVSTNPSSMPSLIEGTITFGTSMPRLSVADGAAADDFEIRGSMRGGSVVYKTGAGQLRISGAQGLLTIPPMTVSEGTVILARTQAPSLTTMLFIGDGAGGAAADVVRFAGNNQINGGTVVIGSSGLLDVNGFSDSMQELRFPGGMPLNTGSGSLTVVRMIVDGSTPTTITGNYALGEVLAQNLTISGNAEFGTLTGGPFVLTGPGVTTGGTILGDATLDKPIDGAFRYDARVVGDLTLLGPEQIRAINGPETFTLSLSHGVFDLNGFSETIGNLDLETVEVTPEGGTLTVIGSIKASQSTSTILERLDLANGTHTFEVIDNSGVPFELDIPGVIPNGGIIKTGSGQMRLGAANTLAGGIRVQSGLVAVGNDGALGMGSVVLQGGALAADGGSRTVANPITIGAGTSGFTSSFDLRLTGTISNSVAATITKSGAGILTFSGPQSYASGSVLRILEGPVRLETDSGATAPNLSLQVFPIVQGMGQLQIASTQHLASLALDKGLAVIEAGGNTVLVTRSLTVDAVDSLLDVGEHAAIVDYTSASPLASIRSAIVSARNGGAWNGYGITSSTAAANPNHSTTLGAMEGSEYRSLYGPSATFRGEPVDDTSVLVRYTYYGDTDFNGRVNFDDYVRTDNGFNNHLTGWLNGDFDLNGQINFDDYVLIDLAFNTQSGTLGRALAYLNGDGGSIGSDADPALRRVEEHLHEFGSVYGQHFLAAVPEPVMGVTAVGGLVAVRCCRRRRRDLRAIAG